MSDSEESDFHMESDGTDFELPVKKTAAKAKTTKAAAEPKAKVSVTDRFFPTGEASSFEWFLRCRKHLRLKLQRNRKQHRNPRRRARRMPPQKVSTRLRQTFLTRWKVTTAWKIPMRMPRSKRRPRHQGRPVRKSRLVRCIKRSAHRYQPRT